MPRKNKGNLLRKKQSKLVKKIKPMKTARYLRQLTLIDEAQYMIIKKTKTTSEKNRIIIKYVRDKGNTGFTELKKCLDATDQHGALKDIEEEEHKLLASSTVSVDPPSITTRASSSNEASASASSSSINNTSVKRKASKKYLIKYRARGFVVRMGPDLKKWDKPRQGQRCSLQIRETSPYAGAVEVFDKKNTNVGCVEKKFSSQARKCLHMGFDGKAIVRKPNKLNTEGKGFEVFCDLEFCGEKDTPHIRNKLDDIVNTVKAMKGGNYSFAPF